MFAPSDGLLIKFETQILLMPFHIEGNIRKSSIHFEGPNFLILFLVIFVTQPVTSRDTFLIFLVLVSNLCYFILCAFSSFVFLIFYITII